MRSAVWTIYCHTHTDSGRRYVGLTKRTWQERWRGHVHGSKHVKTYFGHAILKYGPEAFSHEVLEICQTVEEANAAEEKWIARFDSRNPEKGFNIKKGGLHVPHPISNPWDRPEFRAANAGRNTHHLLKPESREKQLVSLRSEESKARRSARAKASLSSPETMAKRDAMRADPAYRERISASLKAALASPEVRARMSAASSASSTPEVKERRSAAHRAAMSDPGVRSALSSSSKAAWARPEYREMQASRTASEETRARISASSAGRRHTPESIARMRELYWSRRLGLLASFLSALSV